MNASGWLKSRLLLLSGAIALGIGILVAVQLLDSRSATWQRAQASNTNLLFTVSHLIERTLEEADRGLQHTVRVLERDTLAAGNHAVEPLAVPSPLAPENAELLFAGVPDDGYGIQLVLDHQARVIAFSRSPPPGDWQFLERDYFKVHRQAPDVGLFVGAPFVSAYDGQLSIAMSRRWNRPDGSFGGIVVQTLKLSVLHNLFSSLELGADSGINVFLRNGAVVTRFPYSNDYVGSSLKGTENFERFVREGEGSFTGVAVIDGVARLYVFRSLERFPVIVNVAQSAQSILAGWQRSAAWLAVATLVLMCACVALAVFAERRLHAHRRTASRLRQAERELRVVMDSLPVLVAYWDDQLINRLANITHRDWFGVLPEQMRGRHIRELVDDEHYHFVKPYMEEALAGKTQTFEQRLSDPTGAVRHTLTTYIPDSDQGRIKGFFLLATDISERKAAETALFEEKERFRIILESITDGVITTDPQGCVLYLNPAAAIMTGRPLEDACGVPLEGVMRIEQPKRGRPLAGPLHEVLGKRQAVTRMEYVLIGRGDERLYIESAAAPLKDEQGGLRGAVLVFHEVGQARAMANRMSHLAQHDALTGLPNRRRLDQVGRQTLKSASKEGRLIAVLYLDLDGFKQVNDEYGHAVGDEFLVVVTRRLSARLRSSDELYRQGGDEFVVLMDDIGSAEEARHLASRMIESCRAPFSVAGQRLVVTVSIGISIFPDDADDLEALIQLADQAMYVAKNAGRNCYAYGAGYAYTEGQTG